LLDRLASEGVPVALTMSLTPTLGDMLGDDLLRARFEQHLGRLESLLRKELRRAESSPPIAAVTAFYGDRLRTARATWERHRGDLVGALVGHARAGRLDLLASAATHAYLPGLVSTPAAIARQIQVGMRAFEAQTGLRPIGFWLPECAYHPSFDAALAEHGVGYAIVEEAALRLARPRPPMGVYAPIASPSGVAFFGRDPRSSEQVWSRDLGYPGDPSYREYYRDIGFDLTGNELLGEEGPFGARVPTGLKYHRVTDSKTALADKQIYEPGRARMRAFEHAEIFVADRVAHGRELASRWPLESPPIIVAPYDAELFGHWWFEGPWFLEGVCRALARPENAQTLHATTLRQRLRRHPAMIETTPAPSTWGEGASGAVWIDASNASLWRHVHHATAIAIRTAKEARSDDSTATIEARRQLAIEAMLLQASDWPFILKTRTAEGYALARTRAHVARIRKLAAMIDEGRVDAAVVADLARRDDFLGGAP
jgi:1,4-alpha-glucan branching enzyme